MELYLDPTNILPVSADNEIEINSLVTTPSFVSQTIDTVVVANGTSVLKAYWYDFALDNVKVEIGNWGLQIYAAVDNLEKGRSSLIINAYIPFDETATIQVYGTGTQRTVIASFGSPFEPTDASIDITKASYIKTPKGLYQIINFISSNSVTIVVPVTYANEIDVSFKVWGYIAEMTTGDLISTDLAKYTPIFDNPLTSILLVSEISIIAFGRTDSLDNVDISLGYDGITTPSYLSAPLLSYGEDNAVFNQIINIDGTIDKTNINIKSATGSTEFKITSRGYSNGGSIIDSEEIGFYEGIDKVWSVNSNAYDHNLKIHNDFTSNDSMIISKSNDLMTIQSLVVKSIDPETIISCDSNKKLQSLKIGSNLTLENNILSSGTGSSIAAAIAYYLDNYTIIASSSENFFATRTLNTSLITTPQVDVTVSVKASTSPMYMEAYRTPGNIYRTNWRAGTWIQNIYAMASSADPISEVLMNIYDIINFNISPKCTMTGIGVTRTCTSISSIFTSAMASILKQDAWHIETAKGVYPIVGYTSGLIVTIEVPAGYTNESNQDIKLWRKFFGGTTKDYADLSTSIILYPLPYNEASTEVDIPDMIGVIMFAKTNILTPVNITYSHNGNTYYTFFQTPFLQRHDDLDELHLAQLGVEWGHINDLNQTIDGAKQFMDYITAPNYISNVGIGVQPYACSSTFLNINLNADMVDGFHHDQSLLTNASPSFVTLYTQNIENTDTVNSDRLISKYAGIERVNAQEVDSLFFLSSLGTGQGAPYRCGSQDWNENLNADMVDGYHMDQGVMKKDTPFFEKITANYIDSAVFLNAVSLQSVNAIIGTIEFGHAIGGFIEAANIAAGFGEFYYISLYDPTGIGIPIRTNNETLNPHLNADLVDGFHMDQDLRTTATGEIKFLNLRVSSGLTIAGIFNILESGSFSVEAGVYSSFQGNLEVLKKITSKDIRFKGKITGGDLDYPSIILDVTNPTDGTITTDSLLSRTWIWARKNLDVDGILTAKSNINIKNNSSLIIDQGDVTITKGSFITGEGEIFTKQGNITIGRGGGDIGIAGPGNVLITKGNVDLGEGHVLIKGKGGIGITNGYIQIKTGNIEILESGNIGVAKGDIGTQEGDIFTNKGMIQSAKGKIEGAIFRCPGLKNGLIGGNYDGTFEIKKLKEGIDISIKDDLTIGLDAPINAQLLGTNLYGALSGKSIIGFGVFCVCTVTELLGVITVNVDASPVSLGIGNNLPNSLLGLDATGINYEFKTLYGTSNQISVTHGVETVTLSLPSDIIVAPGSMTLVQPATGGSVVDQSSTAYDSFATDNPAWQSFTAGMTGWLTSVDISNESGVVPTVTVSIYSGTGTGGTLLGSHAGVNPIAVGIKNVTFTPSIYITKGQVYTIAVTATNLSFWWTVKTVGTYSGGSYMGTAKDAVFNTYVDGWAFDVRNNYVNISGLTASSVVGADSSKNVISLTLGSNLSLSNNVLTANISAVAAGQVISYYLDDTSIVSKTTENNFEINVLSTVPVVSTPEVLDRTSVTAATSPMYIEAYETSLALGRSFWQSGPWVQNIYAYVDSTVGVSEVMMNVFAVINLNPITVTISGGPGTTRTATASSSIFVAGMANADKTLCYFIRTPKGAYQISAFTSDTVVTITVPSGYINESGIDLIIWGKAFGGTTKDKVATGLTTAITLYNPIYTESAFATGITDKMAVLLFAKTTSVSSRTITFTHNGNLHYSFISTPFITRHDDLAELHTAQSGYTYGHITDGIQTIAGAKTFSSAVSSPLFTSTVAIGTPPFAATSTTQCTNLNAALCNGYSFNQSLQTTDNVTFANITCGANAAADTRSIILNAAANKELQIDFQSAGTLDWRFYRKASESNNLYLYDGTNSLNFLKFNVASSANSASMWFGDTSYGGTAIYLTCATAGKGIIVFQDASGYKWDIVKPASSNDFHINEIITATEHPRMWFKAGGFIGIGGAYADTVVPTCSLHLQNSGVNQCLRISSYGEIGQTLYNAQFYIGINALLTTSSIGSSINKFSPLYNAGTGMVMYQLGGGNGDWFWAGRAWGSSSNEVDLTSFTEVAHFTPAGAIYFKQVPGNTTSSTANMVVNLTTGQLYRSTCGEFWKMNIRPLEIDTSGVYELDAVTFEEKVFNEDGITFTKGATGNSLVANQRAEKYLPKAVIKGKDFEGNVINDSLNWNAVITCLQVELKKLRERIITLESRLLQ